MKLYIVRNNKINVLSEAHKRANEFNERFTDEIQKNLQRNYIQEVRRKNGKKDMDIIECYESAVLAHELYACLVEEDPERLRECVQHLADEKLNRIVPILYEIGYVI